MGIALAVAQRTLDAPGQHELLDKFLYSRREGLSLKTLKFYSGYLNRASCVIGPSVSGQDMSRFVESRQCSNGGKHSYFRALRAFYNRLYPAKSPYKINRQDNPMLGLDAPKLQRPILASLTQEQIDTLISMAHSLRDRCVISLLADSGMRLTELTSIKAHDIDWGTCTVTIWGKGNKHRRAPFTKRTAGLLQQHVKDYQLWT